jgi:DNA-binding transcriptional ArsR family regulator
MTTHRASLAREVHELHANLCGVLADPRRILVLYLLAKGARRVNQIVAELNLPQPTVSRHLRILRESGLVNATHQGTGVEYRLADYQTVEALDLLREVMRDALARQNRLLRVHPTRKAAGR